MANQMHKQMLIEALNKCDSNEKNAWWRLNLLLTYDSKFESNIKVLPSWQNADHETQKRIVDAAKNYLLTAAVKDERWFRADSIWPPVFVGYRALILLFQEEPKYIHSLSREMWTKWAATIVTYSSWTRDSDESLHQQLIKLAYQRIPATICRYFLRMIDDENAHGSVPVVLKNIIYCLDGFLFSVLEGKLLDDSLKPEYFAYLLEELLNHDGAKARSYAEFIVADEQSPQNKDKAAVAARTLSRHLTETTWSFIWKQVISDTQFGRSLLLDIAYEYHWEFKDILTPLSERQLADLYIWLEQQFPRKEDTHSESFIVGPDKSVRDFRDWVLEYLTAKGTKQAVSEMKRIVAKFPELTWQRQKALEAQAQMRLSTWEPLQPETILELASNPQKRLVQNGEQLLDVIIESLKRLEQKLHGETPAVVDVWNEFVREEKTVFRPKDENDFSNYVKRYLEDDLKGRGIIINREVEIRRKLGSTPGEITDIHVDAIKTGDSANQFDKISVIIEAKGCWNEELKTAADTQLKSRYLNVSSCCYGLYLVGWFSCDQWDSKDSRKRKSPKMPLEEAQKLFSQQAAQLSSDGIVIKAFLMNTAL